MEKLNYEKSIRFWQLNGAAKKDFIIRGDKDGLSCGLYDDFPSWLNRYYAFFQNRIVVRFLKQIALGPQSRILEIGCGAGRWCRKLALQPHRSIVGIDISRHLLQAKHTNESSGTYFVNATGSDLPIKTAGVDLVYSVAVIHHMPFEIQVAAFKEISRVLKKGAYLFMLESTETESASKHLFARSPAGWIDLLEGNGFHVKDRTGQEYVDWRRIIRPLRRRLRLIASGISKAAPDDESNRDGSAEFRIHGAGLTIAQHLFHLMFLPLVYAAYPLEWMRSKTNDMERANYAGILAYKK